MTSQPRIKSVKIVVRSDPFLGDPRQASDFYAELGRAIVLWGRFEMNICTMLWIILGLPGSAGLRPLLAHGFPKSFKKKRELWKRAFETMPILTELKDHALPFISRAAAAAKRRDAIVHSAWTEFVTAEPPACKAHLFNHSIDGVPYSTRTVDINELVSLAGDIDGLNINCLAFLSNLIPLSRRPRAIADGKSPQPDTGR